MGYFIVQMPRRIKSYSRISETTEAVLNMGGSRDAACYVAIEENSEMAVVHLNHYPVVIDS
jgi:hypothetical protein